VTKEGTYMQPMLIDQIAYLYFMVSDADQALGQDALQRLEVLMQQFTSLKATLQ